MSNIAFITGTYQPKHCGVAHYTSHLRHALAQQGVSSTVLTTSEAAKRAEEAGVIGAVKKWRLVNMLPLLRAIHTTQADILHIQHAAGTYGFERAIFLLPLLLRLTGWRSPIITTIHEYGWWEWQPNWLPADLLETLKNWGQQRQWWDREDGFLITQSDEVITTNHSAEQIIHNRLPNSKQKVHQIPIGANVSVASIDKSQARQRVRQACGWTEDTQIIAFFGFLHPVKGLETLLSAFKQVSQTHPNARLLLIGGVESLALQDEQASNYWNKLQAEIAKLGLHGKVCLTGYLEEAAASRCLSSADIGVLPFNHGVTLKSGSLLAMLAHSLPTIATCSNPPDPELSDRFVQLTSPHDEAQLAAKISDLLDNPDLQLRLGAAGHQFSQKFTWQGIADAHLDIYQSVLTQNSVPTERLTA